MTARLTEAQARALGIGATKQRTPRRTEPGPYHTRCTCGEHFTVRAREDEHVSAGHCRFEVVL